MNPLDPLKAPIENRVAICDSHMEQQTDYCEVISTTQMNEYKKRSLLYLEINVLLLLGIRNRIWIRSSLIILDPLRQIIDESPIEMNGAAEYLCLNRITNQKLIDCQLLLKLVLIFLAFSVCLRGLFAGGCWLWRSRCLRWRLWLGRILSLARCLPLRRPSCGEISLRGGWRRCRCRGRGQ